MRVIAKLFLVSFTLLQMNHCQLLASSSTNLNCQLMDDTPAMTELTLTIGSSARCQLSPAGYRILPTPSRLGSYFSVREPDSSLYTSRLVDLDRLCAEIGQCCQRELPNCTISLMLQKGVSVVLLDLVILDRNDHGPVFNCAQPFRMELSERREPDSTHSSIDLPVATDIDRQEFGVLRYELQPNDTVFQLEEIQRENSEPKPVLKQIASLDRETRASYSYVLYAIDRGQPRLTGSATVIINISDVNDNKPVFDQLVYNATVKESISSGQQVLCVNATDLDEGDYGRVRYSIKTPPGVQTINSFNINSISGCLYTTMPLNYEFKKEFLFSVVAIDCDRSPNSAEAEVKIKVEDVNDCLPNIAIYKASTEGILEGNRTAEQIGFVQVTDDDSGGGGRVSCTAEPSEKFRLENTSSSMFDLFLTASLDRETNPTEQVRVCCTDQGIPPLHSCKDASFKVLDVNDEAPKFTQSIYHASVAENISRTLLPSYVSRVEAVDRDEAPVNNRVTYSIGVESRDYFYINNRTGTLMTWRALDRETHSSFVILVNAEDPGGLKDSATVSLSVRDVNDNAPVLHYPRGQLLEVLENCSVKTEVGSVEATDADSGEYRRIRFTLLSGSGTSAGHDFRVDPVTGKIFTNRQLDRERQQSYELRILVSDNPSGGSSQQNSVTATLTVRLIDVNDNAPHIQFPTVENNTFGVSWREPAFQPVLQVRAADRDEAENGLLRFELKQPSGGSRSAELFHIDPTDGKIRINRPMTELDIGDHHLAVRVFDSAIESPRSSQIRLIIRVDRSSPKFLPAASAQPPRDGRSPGRAGGGVGGDGHSDEADGRRQANGNGTILVAAVGLACALTLILLAVALGLCQRRGLFAELLSSADQRQQQQQQQQQRIRRKTNGGSEFAGGGGGQLEALAFLGSANRRADGSMEQKTFPSVTSSLNQSDATAVTFDDAGNYVTYGAGRMQRRVAQQQSRTMDTCGRAGATLATGKQQQQPSVDFSGYQEALSCSEGRPPTYYDLDTSATRRQLAARASRASGTAEFVQLLARSGSAGNLFQQQQRQPPPPQQPLAPLSLTLTPSGAPCTDHVTRKRLADPKAADGGRAASFDLFEAGDHTLKHHGKLYSIPKASYV